MVDVAAEPEAPEHDRLTGAPHPRHTARLCGQDQAERTFLDAYNSGRLHHGWLLTGPRGIGKATLAWRIARFILSQPLQDADQGMLLDAPMAPSSLDVAPDSPVGRRISALAEPNLFLLRTRWDNKEKRFRQGIAVDDVRELKKFFQLSSTDGRRRVVIVDSADEMNVSAANALLKVLEEPPRDALMLLVSHQPARLLPTIRSRCTTLRCRVPDAASLGEALGAMGLSIDGATAALAELSSGSVGQAVRLLEQNGIEVYRELLGIVSTVPRLDRARALKLADDAGGRGKQEKFELVGLLLDTLLARLALTAASGPLPEAAPGEAEVLARLSSGNQSARRWALVQQELGARLRQGSAVNLDPSSLLLDTLVRINEAASELAA